MGNFEDIFREIHDKVKWKVSFNGGLARIYNQVDKGYFVEFTEEESRRNLRSLEVLKFSPPSTITNLIQAITEQEKRVIDEELFLKSRENIIGFENGVFDLRKGVMRAYTNKDFWLNPLPHSIPKKIDEGVNMDLFRIAEEWSGDMSSAEWFLDMLAYVLFEFPNNEHIWINFFQHGMNGKSSCLSMLEKIVGQNRVIGADLGNMNRFSTSSFHRKWLVIGRDSNHIVPDSAVSFIKSYCGDKHVLAEFKGGKTFDSHVSGKIIVSTNDLVHSRDRSSGWYRRLIPVPFPNTFTLNPSFDSDIEKKLPKIIRCLLHRAYCYKHNKIRLTTYLPERVRDLRQETKFYNDRVAAYWENEFFIESETMEGKKKEPDLDRMYCLHGLQMNNVYRDFCSWHDENFNGIKIEPSIRSFGGQYGGFMSKAKDYFQYVRKSTGRFVFLHPDVLSNLEEERE